jgi:hypothetical protein
MDDVNMDDNKSRIGDSAMAGWAVTILMILGKTIQVMFIVYRFSNK